MSLKVALLEHLQLDQKRKLMSHEGPHLEQDYELNEHQLKDALFGDRRPSLHANKYHQYYNHNKSLEHMKTEFKFMIDHNSSKAAVAVEQYSTSMEKQAIVCCFLELQETRLGPRKIIYAPIEV